MSGPYQRFNFPTWHEIGVLEEAMKEVKRSPVPLIHDMDHIDCDPKKHSSSSRQEQASLSSVIDLLGSYIRKYLDVDLDDGGNDGQAEEDSVDTLDILSCFSEDEHEEDKLVIVQVSNEEEGEERERDESQDDEHFGVYEEVLRSFNLGQGMDMSQINFSVLTPEGFLTFEESQEQEEEKEKEGDL